MRAKWLLIVVILCGLPARNAIAQAFPNKPIRLIVGFAPGGGVDIGARLIGRKLTESLGQPVVVDNRSGAGGIVAADLVAKASPDGYTLLMAPSNHATTPALYKSLPYDTLKDFAPVSTVAYNPHVMVVSASLAASSVKEFIALAKSKPGELNYGSGGVGSGTHLEAELLNAMAGITLVHIPYKGVGLALGDLAAARVQVVFCSILAALPFIKTGKAKAVAVTSSKRSAIMPDVPTFAESGLPQFIVESPQGVFAPAGTPREVINTLNGEIVKITRTAEVRDLMAKQGSEAAGSTPQEYGAKISEEVVRWKKIVKEAGIPVQ